MVIVTSLISKSVNQEEKKNPLPVARKTNSWNTTEDSSLQDYVVEMRMWGNEAGRFNNTAVSAVKTAIFENFPELQYSLKLTKWHSIREE